MTADSKKEQALSYLPEGTVRFIRWRLIELLGLILVALGAVTIAALYSFNAADPSWSNATSELPTNMLGRPGSFAADLLFQGIGLSAYALVIVCFTWGWRLVSHQMLPHFKWNALALPGAIILGSMAFSSLAPVESFWKLRLTMGGITGQTLDTHLYELLALLPIGVPEWAVSSLLFALAMVLLLLSLGISWREWVIMGRGTKWALQQMYWGLSFVIAKAKGLKLPERPAKNAPGSSVKVENDGEKANIKTGLTLKRPSNQAKPDEAADKGSDTPISAEKAPIKAEKPKIKVAAPPPKLSASKRQETEKQPSLDLVPDSDYALPPLSLLEDIDSANEDQHDPEALEQNARQLESVLQDFGVKGEIVQVKPGPVVTLYELEPAAGIKTARVINLSDDIARSMSALSVRSAVVPGQSVIGIELPNAQRQMVGLKEVLSSDAFESSAGKLAMVLGKDIGGEPVIADLARMPHLLVAGTTGSGKSVGINTMITSLLYRLSPKDCRMIMIDPKMIELSVYNDIPHLLTPVVTEPGKAVVALKWAVREMDDRYRMLSQLGVRNIEGFNNRVAEATARGEPLARKVQTGFDEETRQPIYEEQELAFDHMPYIVCIIDEFADLMMTAGKEVEACVVRLAQKARAAGIHLIMATQRPSVDVITGVIKANFPTRISFQVTSKIDSRTILGVQGAEQLLGMGDMLYMSSGGRLTRVHGPFVSDEEVEEIANFVRSQGAPEYIAEVTTEPEDMDGGGEGGDDDSDPVWIKAIEIVRTEKKCSTSYLQRRLSIGYNRAARLVDQMEEMGMVSPANHAGKREVLID